MPEDLFDNLFWEESNDDSNVRSDSADLGRMYSGGPDVVPDREYKSQDLLPCQPPPVSGGAGRNPVRRGKGHGDVDRPKPERTVTPRRHAPNTRAPRQDSERERLT